ncbi:hypothetical protein [Janthinobacterium sp. PC23-8]|uniref:hypothetical protein n=1 Tax=Janthinobacterium sp. PC23-8 TaxID=2012679 RepID=UPI000B97784D|nr:hypothetical protein [Janthinobacterium sp. PC23-8]OYO27906.1 hypothetical protein CD932_22605 [Janthinobacterium sp. PC23-8]
MENYLDDIRKSIPHLEGGKLVTVALEKGMDVIGHFAIYDENGKCVGKQKMSAHRSSDIQTISPTRVAEIYGRVLTGTSTIEDKATIEQIQAILSESQLPRDADD